MKARLKQAAEDALVMSVRWVLPIFIAIGPVSWLVVDYYQTRARANASFFYLQAMAQKAQQAQSAPAPTPSPSLPNSQKPLGGK